MLKNVYGINNMQTEHTTLASKDCEEPNASYSNFILSHLATAVGR